jgi:hypothetical protein
MGESCLLWCVFLAKSLKSSLPGNCFWLTKSEASKINGKYMKENGKFTGRKQKNPNKLNHIAPSSTRFILIPTHSVRMR